MDEWCIRFSPSLWLYIHARMNWVAVSPLTRSVIGFVIDDRTDAALNRLLEEELHPAWREVPIKTDGWEAYQRLLSAEQHEVCAKTSGKTSMAEALNCKWRQRQSGLTRKSCGVCWRIRDDVSERFLILADFHNRQCLKRWQAVEATTPITQ